MNRTAPELVGDVVTGDAGQAVELRARAPVSSTVDYGPVELDFDAALSLPDAVLALRRRGTRASRASIYRWNADRIAEGLRPLIHQPSGPGTKIYVVPSEVDAHIRSKWSDNQAAGGAGR